MVDTQHKMQKREYDGVHGGWYGLVGGNEMCCLAKDGEHEHWAVYKTKSQWFWMININIIVSWCSMQGRWRMVDIIIIVNEKKANAKDVHIVNDC